MRLIGFRRLAELEGSGPDASQGSAGYTTRETVLLLVAAVAGVGGLIHLGAAVDHFGEFPPYTVVFVLLAAVQMTWAAMILRRPSRPVLLFGVVFNLGVIALWIASRTIGVPIAPRPWVPEAVGVPDLVETLGELVAVIAILSVVISPQLAIARQLTARMGPVLLFVLLVSVLYGVGGHAG
jgi:hypothetical protein